MVLTDNPGGPYIRNTGTPCIKHSVAHGLLFVERFWTADERTVAKMESQQAVRVAGNADPDALPDVTLFVVIASEP